MIKKDIARYLYETHGGITLDEAKRYTETLIELLEEAITAADSVSISGFGRFRHKQRRTREVVMPDGSKQLTSAVDRIQFLPSPKLKAEINVFHPPQNKKGGKP